MIVAQASPDEVLDQLAADPFVLRRRFDEAQGDLLAVHRDPQSDHDLFVGKALSVNEQGHEAVVVEGTLLELLQLLRGGFDEPPRDGGR